MLTLQGVPQHFVLENKVCSPTSSKCNLTGGYLALSDFAFRSLKACKMNVFISSYGRTIFDSSMIVVLR